MHTTGLFTGTLVSEDHVHDYCSAITDKAVGKDYQVAKFIYDAIKLMHVLYYKRTNDPRSVQLFGFGVLSPGKLLLSP